MALTYTPELELGTELPQVKLQDVNGEWHTTQSLADAPAKVIVFICGHCPYVQAIEDRLIQLGHSLKKLGVPMWGVCSNDATEYPEDSPETLRIRWAEKKYSFPYLIDPTQEAAKIFGAVCTPDFFVYDKKNKLRYRGRLDDSWRDATKVTKEELLHAVKTLLDNKPLNQDQHPSLGCSIKWKS